MPRAPIVFRTVHRPAFDDLDPHGHMSTASYVSTVVNHRFTGLRERLDIDQSALSRLPFILVTRKLELEFLRSIRGDEPFEISSWVSGVGDVDCEVSGEIHTTDRKLAAAFLIRITCVSKQTRRACPWSEGFLDRFFVAEADGATTEPPTPGGPSSEATRPDQSSTSQSIDVFASRAM